MAIKICLDAGHYGKYNQSPADPAYYESDMNWKLHLLLKKYLEQYGIQVITTRETQEKDKGTISRGKLAKGCDLFLSIHSNAADDEATDYPLVIVPIDGSGDTLGVKLAECIEETMGTNQNGRIWERKSDSGKDWYGVLNGATSVGTTGLILEHSFHTNTRSTKWLLDDANLDKMARAEADVIAAHFGLKKATRTVYTVTVSRTFNSKAEAEKALSAHQADGYTGKITEQTVDTPAAETPTTPPVAPVKTVTQIAQEVIQGKWGNGQERKDRLTAAGYVYKTIQAAVNKLLK